MNEWHKMPDDPPKSRGFYIVAVPTQKAWKTIKREDMLIWLYDGQEFEYCLPVVAWHEMPPAYVEEETNMGGGR